MVRAFYMSGGQRKFGPWSNVEYITPSPTKLTAKNTSSGTNLKMNIKWNIIYGCNGYNVFLTTNPNGTWYWNQSTSIKADAIRPDRHKAQTQRCLLHCAHACIQYQYRILYHQIKRIL